MQSFKKFLEESNDTMTSKEKKIISILIQMDTELPPSAFKKLKTDYLNGRPMKDSNFIENTEFIGDDTLRNWQRTFNHRKHEHNDGIVIYWDKLDKNFYLLSNANLDNTKKYYVIQYMSDVAL